MWEVPHAHPGILAFPEFFRGDVPRIAEAIDAFVRRPPEIIARQIESGGPPVAVSAENPFTNRLYYRRSNGFWVDAPPKRRR